MAKQYPRVMNQVDHRRSFFERAAAGKVEKSGQPKKKAPPRAAGKRKGPIDAKTGKPLTLAEQLGMLQLMEKKKNQKPSKRIKAPVTLNADEPKERRPAPLPQIVAPAETPEPEAEIVKEAETLAPPEDAVEEMPVVAEEQPAVLDEVDAFISGEVEGSNDEPKEEPQAEEEEPAVQDEAGEADSDAAAEEEEEPLA